MPNPNPKHILFSVEAAYSNEVVVLLFTKPKTDHATTAAQAVALTVKAIPGARRVDRTGHAHLAGPLLVEVLRAVDLHAEDRHAVDLHVEDRHAQVAHLGNSNESLLP